MNNDNIDKVESWYQWEWVKALMKCYVYWTNGYVFDKEDENQLIVKTNNIPMRLS